MATQPAENYLLGKVGRSNTRVVPAASFQPPEISNVTQSGALPKIGQLSLHPATQSIGIAKPAPVVSATATGKTPVDN
jgi:hypothetical protein